MFNKLSVIRVIHSFAAFRSFALLKFCALVAHYNRMMNTHCDYFLLAIILSNHKSFPNDFCRLIYSSSHRISSPLQDDFIFSLFTKLFSSRWKLCQHNKLVRIKFLFVTHIPVVVVRSSWSDNESVNSRWMCASSALQYRRKFNGNDLKKEIYPIRLILNSKCYRISFWLGWHERAWVSGASACHFHFVNT